MAIIGLRDTSGFTTAGERPQNWRETLLLLYPNSAEAAKAPLTALTSLMKEKSTDDPHFHWFTKTLDDRRVKLTAALTAVAAGTAGTLTVDPAFKPAIVVYENSVLYVEQTGEVLLVTADPIDSTSIQVTRGFGASTPTAIDPAVAGTNPYALIIGSAFEEGSMPPSGVNFDPEELYNYTQIFRRTLEITRTAAKTRLRTGDAVKEARREALEYTSVDMERAFILGRRSLSTYKGKPQRTTGGVVWQIAQAAPENIWTVPTTGSVDMNTLELKLETLFRYGSYEKMAFAGNGALLALQQIVRKNTNYQIFANEKEYGMKITRLVTPFGELAVKVHPLFTQNAGGVTAGTEFTAMSNWLLILDMERLRYRYLTDSDLDYQTKLEPNGLDGMQSGYLAECGIEIEFAETCHLWKNVRAGIKDAA
jgi:Family of unknown function (DUF5309)